MTPDTAMPVALREYSPVTTDTAVPVSRRWYSSVTADTAVPVSLRGYSLVTTDTAMPVSLPIALNGEGWIRPPPRTRQCRDPTDRPRR